jgi:hypothetical protein
MLSTYILALNHNARATMTRDLGLIRAILSKIQQSKTAPMRERIDIPTYDDDTIDRHLELLHQEGFIEAQKSAPLSGRVAFVIKDLTWKGHNLAGALGYEAVWAKLRDKFSQAELASMPIDVLEQTISDMTGQWAKDKAR